MFFFPLVYILTSETTAVYDVKYRNWEERLILSNKWILVINSLTNCWEANQAWGLLSNCVKDLRLAVLWDVMSNFKVPKRSTALGVYHSFGDSLPVKMTHLIQELDILQQEGSAGSHWHGGGLSVDGSTISSSTDIWFLEERKMRPN